MEIYEIYHEETGAFIGRVKLQKMAEFVEEVRKLYNKNPVNKKCRKKLRGYWVCDCIAIIRNDGILWATAYHSDYFRTNDFDN